MVQIYKDEAVIFDLDDLLYKEFDFVRSGFWNIASAIGERESKKLFRLMMVQYFSGEAVFDWVINEYFKGKSHYTVESLLNMYRTHKPDICLSSDASELLSKLRHNGNSLGLITDGRSITQRNKIEALGLNKWFNDYTISEEYGHEKPSPLPFQYYMDKLNVGRYIYLADNHNKDFIAPNKLGWRTIALRDNGLNVHTPKEDLISANEPLETINNFMDLEVRSETWSS